MALCSRARQAVQFGCTTERLNLQRKARPPANSSSRVGSVVVREFPYRLMAMVTQESPSPLTAPHPSAYFRCKPTPW